MKVSLNDSSHGQLVLPFGLHQYGIANKQAQVPTEDNKYFNTYY